ncbi:hypothetical protein ACJRO7_008543 [Eucalyptus globulus]|uniref:Uncharacterized protein n=1 Tax=Eucalyptus globulus TaxID=34317 RepID=A0ABD3IS21_EUCGL
MAAIVFSRGGKPFSFGHPSGQAVVDRVENPKTAGTNATQQAHIDGDQTVEELNKQCTKDLHDNRVEKKRAEEVKHGKLPKIENLSFNELMVMLANSIT